MGGQKPFFYKRADVVELRDFNEDRGNRRGAAGNELQVSDGSEEGGTAALSLLPTFTLLKAKVRKEAGQTVKFSARRARRGNGTDNRDSLNHRFDCIVWECDGIAVAACWTGLNCRGGCL